MDAQLSLPGIAPAPRRIERFYLAVLPEPAVRPRLAELGSELSAGRPARYRPTAEHRLHISLQHLGDHAAVPREYLQRAIDAVGRIRMPAFDVRFDRAMVFSGRALGPGPFPLVLCASDGQGIRQLATSLAKALHQGRLPADFGSRLPHVTLGYTPARMAPRTVPAIAWRVRDFALLHVRLGIEAAHRVVGRWRLADFEGEADEDLHT